MHNMVSLCLFVCLLLALRLGTYAPCDKSYCFQIAGRQHPSPIIERAAVTTSYFGVKAPVRATVQEDEDYVMTPEEIQFLVRVP